MKFAKMVEKYAKAIRSRAVQERSIAVSCFKSVWLSNASPFALVTNVLTTDLKKKADMAVNQALIDTDINTVDSNPISDLLTVAHEGWIRMELHYNLKKQAARHRGTKDDNTARTKEWQMFCALVFQDRDDNEEQATLDRGIAVTDSAANDDEDDEDDEADSVPACDPKYFKRK
jgi:hypothetical protein